MAITVLMKYQNMSLKTSCVSFFSKQLTVLDICTPMTQYLRLVTSDYVIWRIYSNANNVNNLTIIVLIKFALKICIKNVWIIFLRRNYNFFGPYIYNLHSQEQIYPTSDLCNAISSESIKMGRSGSNVTSVHDCISYLNNICVQMLVLWSSV